MIYLAKIIAYTMLLMICSKQFPTFWGGFYTLAGIIVGNALLSIRVSVKKGDSNE